MTFPWCGGHKINNFLSPYPLDATYQIWLRLAQLFLKRRMMLTHDGNDGRQPIAIGHLSDSVDLKTQQSSLYSSTCKAKVFCFDKTRKVNI